MMRGYYGGFWGFGLGLICIIILFGILYSIFGDKKNIHCHHKHNTPLDELKNRYAKGEITKKEFDIIKKDIE